MNTLLKQSVKIQHYSAISIIIMTFLSETQTGAFLRSSVTNLNLRDVLMMYSLALTQKETKVSSQSMY